MSGFTYDGKSNREKVMEALGERAPLYTSADEMDDDDVADDDEWGEDDDDEEDETPRPFVFKVTKSLYPPEPQVRTFVARKVIWAANQDDAYDDMTDWMDDIEAHAETLAWMETAEPAEVGEGEQVEYEWDEEEGV